MKTLLYLIVLIFLLWPNKPAHAQEYGIRADWIAAYEARRDSLIDFYADQIDPTDRSQGGYMQVAADLYRGQDLDWAMARLDTLMQDSRGDMFWMYPMTLVNFVGKDVLPAEYRHRLRDLWRTYTPYRGDTENHWAMYYASLYLMTQLYPDEPGKSWYTGKSSEENHAEARDYLIAWMDLTTTKGQGEFDSPGYMSFYVAPMALLYAFADDPAMRLRAHMMLDYLLADFAVDNLDGLYVGGHSRIYPDPLLHRWADNSSSFAWMLFGNTPFRPRGESMILAISGYEPPEVLYHIGTDRAESYLHKELKRTRHRIRHSTIKNAPVYKTTYMRPEYAVASMQGGLLQPIQQHTWEVLWAVDDVKEGNNLFFTVHPYADAYELTMYFPEEWEILVEGVTKSKSTYNSWDKWTGGSPFEQVVQHKDAVIALYNIEPGTRFPHIGGFFSKNLVGLEEDDSGWIFARGGDALIAYYPLAPYEWMDEADGNRRLHSTSLKNGAVVQVAPAADYDSFDAFKEAVRTLPLESAIEPLPSVTFTTLDGTTMQTTYDETPQINGKDVDYEGWQLFDGPFLQAEKGSRQLEMTHGKLHRLLDFNTLTIKDWVEE
ncbi:MAG TPA: hypothetical protein VKP65_11335 [Rhodothermales bacterium]|nr:hypothetical protein [Rhodothermales bacterium]